MIEVRMNLVDMKRIKNDILYSITMQDRLRAAGMPIIGTLLMRGVERGVIVWHVEPDLDGDIGVIRWYDVGESMTPGTEWVEIEGEQLQAHSWTKYRLAGVTVEDEEL